MNVVFLHLFVSRLQKERPDPYSLLCLTEGIQDVPHAHQGLSRLFRALSQDMRLFSILSHIGIEKKQEVLSVMSSDKDEGKHKQGFPCEIAATRGK